MPPKKQHEAPASAPRQENVPAAKGKTPSAAANMELTDYAGTQKDERDALESIYMEDFQQIESKPAAWNKSPEIAFKIRVRSRDDPKVAATLSVKLPATYPKTVPILSIQDIDSGNPEVPKKLRGIIESRPKELLGSVMIFDILDLLQDVLDDAAKLKAANEGGNDLLEERKAQEAAIEKQALEREQDLLRQRKDETAEEDRILAEQVQLELQRQEKTRLHRRKLTASNTATGEIPQESVTFDQPMTTRDVKGHTTFQFQSVWGRFVVFKAKDKKITIVNPVTDKDVLVPQLLLKDIYLTEKSSETAKFRREMQDIEELLESSKIHRHANVVELLGYKIKRSISTENTGGSVALWELSILSEYANRGSLLELLEIAGSLGAQKVRSWTHQILDALEFFDQHGYVHPAVHLGNILLFRSQSGAINVKLSDGYGTVLKNLVMESKQEHGYVVSETPFWTAPELTQKQSHRSNKTCIWDLGVVVLQMVFGKDVTSLYTSPSNCMAGNDLSIPLEDMLDKMFEPEPKKRPKAFDLTNMRFIHDDQGPLLNSNSPTTPSIAYRRPRNRSSYILPALSRYETEWEQFELLGKGGFGEVVKARNRMDGQFYAVKKVVCESDEALGMMLSETKLLSRLNHPFVVRYFNAWDEKERSEDYETPQQSTSFDEEDNSTFETDPFGLSSIGHDFMSSSNYRNIGIQFGDSDDEEDPSDEKEDYRYPVSQDSSSHIDREGQRTPDSPVSPLKRRGSRNMQNRAEKTTLYIQMEYCENHTLRDLIQQGLYSNTEEGWRYFRQILEGLAHIHANAIVHRDLKPDNIFIGKGNNPRIGDFGLATSGHFTASTRNSASLVAGPETRSIGTRYYVAPELGSRGSGMYTSKVDMYSLGIIFFEMCYPLKTYMERDEALMSLRQKNHSLPVLFQNPELALQGQIILRLLSHDQSSRPSAAELLKDGSIPEPHEEEKFQRYLVGISETNPESFRKVLSSLLSQPVRKAQDLAWDNRDRDNSGFADSPLAASIKDKLASLFRLHGAVEHNRQPVFPKSDHYSGANVATYLDRSGLVLQLPYDLTLPLARSLASGLSEYEKLYTFGDVYRSSAEGSEPVKIPEVDFDIVSYGTIDLALKEAEVIKVLDEVICSFPGLRTKVISIYVNHSDLLDLILDFCRIKREQQGLVKVVLSKLGLAQHPWSRIRAELRSDSLNIAATSLDDLARFDFRDNLDNTREKLEVLFQNTYYADRLAQIFARIDAVLTYVSRLNVRTKVFVSPLSNSSERLYRGSLLIQCMNDSQKKILAVGGRYDTLIGEFLPKANPNQARAVGFRFSLLDVLQAVKSESRKSGSGKSSKYVSVPTALMSAVRRCDVLITSPDSTILRSTGIEILQDMWANGISAELASDFGSLRELGVSNKDDQHLWIVSIRYDSGAIGERSIKVRNVIKKEDADVTISDLSSWLKAEIRERYHREGTTELNGSKLRREISSGEAPGSSGDPREVDVRVISSQHRAKKINRHQIIDVAVSRTRELVESFLAESPILSVDTSDETIESLRDTRLSDPESWRAATHAASVQERKYLQQVQEQLQQMARSGKRGAFLFNHRTRACIYYDLGRST